MISCLAPSFLPATCVLELTYKCNHQCLFCSCPWEAPKSSFIKHKELNLEQWKHITSSLAAKGVASFALSGGEPLLFKDIFKLIEHIASLKSELIETENQVLVSKYVTPKIYLISNGAFVTQQVLDICKQYSIHLGMSLPGIKSFKYHTGNKNYAKILDLFAKAKSMNIETNVGITVTQKNLPELYENISLALIAGADSMLINRFLPGGRGIKYAKELMLSIDQTNEMLDIAEEVLTQANRKGTTGTELPKCIIKNNHYKNLSIGTTCSAGIDFFAIDPSGYLRACNHSPVRLNHFNELDQLKSDAYWKIFTLKQYHPQMCVSCKLLHTCDGGCREAAHIYSGSVNSPDPLLV